MKNIKLYSIFDFLFRLTIIFLLVFVWVLYLIKTIWISIIISIIFTLLIDFGRKLIFDKKRQRNKILSDQKEKMENCINSFVLDTKKNVVDFFYNLAKSKHNAVKNNNYIIVSHHDKKIVLYPYFLYSDLSVDNFIEIINKTKKENATRLIICTKSVDSNVFVFAKNLNYECVILEKEQTFNLLLEKYQIFPKQIEIKKDKKTSFNEILCFALNKKRTKGYFFASILLLLSCFIVPYKLYYCIMSSILLVVSFVSYINPKFNQVKKQNILDV